jgi:cyclin-dependent kinase regulatory subunit CKS1
MGRYPYTIDYSKTYSDDNFEYRHVHLTKSVFLTMHVMTACKRLLTETEWRGLGVVQSRGWEHYAIYAPEPHILLFRRPLGTDPRTGKVKARKTKQAAEEEAKKEDEQAEADRLAMEAAAAESKAEEERIVARKAAQEAAEAEVKAEEEKKKEETATASGYEFCEDEGERETDHKRSFEEMTKTERLARARPSGKLKYQPARVKKIKLEHEKWAVDEGTDEKPRIKKEIVMKDTTEGLGEIIHPLQGVWWNAASHSPGVALHSGSGGSNKGTKKENMTDTDTTVESDLTNPKRRAVDSNLPNPKRRLEVVSDCYLKIIGTRYEVWKGDALKTKGGLRRENLFLDKHGKVASIKTSQQQTEKNKSRRVYCRKAIGPCAFGCATSSGRDSRKTTKFLLDPSNKSRYLCQMHYLREWKKLRQPVAKCITVPP